MHDLKSTRFRLKAFCCVRTSATPAAPTGGPLISAGWPKWYVPPRPSRLCSRNTSAASTSNTSACSDSRSSCASRSRTGACIQQYRLCRRCAACSSPLRSPWSPRTGRRRLGLPLSGQGQPPSATAHRRPAENRHRYRLESAGTAVQTLSATHRPRQTRQSGGGRHRPRAGGLHVGHRPHGAHRALKGASTSNHAPMTQAPSHWQRRSPGFGSTFVDVRRLRPSSLDRSRRPTDTSKVVTNPRISA